MSFFFYYRAGIDSIHYSLGKCHIENDFARNHVELYGYWKNITEYKVPHSSHSTNRCHLLQEEQSRVHSPSSTKSCREFPILQHNFAFWTAVDGWQCWPSILKVTPIMKLVCYLFMILSSTGCTIEVREPEEVMFMHTIMENSDTQEDSKHHTQIDVINCEWLKARDMLCSCHLQIMDLSYDVGRWQCGKVGDASG